MPSKFNWQDPLLLDDQFSTEETAVRDAARSYAQDKLMPRVKAAFRDETFDAAILREMGSLGLLGVGLEGFGCPGGMRTRAKQQGGNWKLSGSKSWISHAPVADVFIVWAKDDAGVIRGFVLERGMQGLTTPVIEGKWSLRASITGQVVMDEVSVP